MRHHSLQVIDLSISNSIHLKSHDVFIFRQFTATLVKIQIIKNPPDDFGAKDFGTKVQEVVKSFFQEINEVVFLKDDSKETYMLCFDKAEAGKYRIGERAVEFWMRAVCQGILDL